MSAPLSSTDWVTLTVPGDVRVLGVVRRTVQAVAQLAGLSDRATYDAVLAVSEAAANVIEHAYDGKPGQTFTVSCRAVSEGVEILLRDQAEPFDFESAPHLPPGELREGGRGVFLIRKLMDDVSSSQPAEGGNELRMFKRREK